MGITCCSDVMSWQLHMQLPDNIYETISGNILVCTRGIIMAVTDREEHLSGTQSNNIVLLKQDNIYRQPLLPLLHVMLCI